MKQKETVWERVIYSSNKHFNQKDICYIYCAGHIVVS